MCTTHDPNTGPLEGSLTVHSCPCPYSHHFPVWSCSQRHSLHLQSHLFSRPFCFMPSSPTSLSAVSPPSHSRAPLSTDQLMSLFTWATWCAFDSTNLSFESSLRASPWSLPCLQCLTPYQQIICQISEHVGSDWKRMTSSRKAQSLFLTLQKPWLHSGLATP